MFAFLASLFSKVTASLFKKAASVAKETTGLTKDIVDIKKTRLETKLIEKQVEQQESPIQIATFADIEKYDPKVGKIATRTRAYPGLATMLALVVAVGGALTVGYWATRDNHESESRTGVQHIQLPSTPLPQSPSHSSPNQNKTFFGSSYPKIFYFPGLPDTPNPPRCGKAVRESRLVVFGEENRILNAHLSNFIITDKCRQLERDLDLRWYRRIAPDTMEVTLDSVDPKSKPIILHISKDQSSFLLEDENGRPIARAWRP